MGELLREDGVYEDFSVIAKAGFGHVRIPIDPLALNMRQSQPIPQRFQAKSNAPIWGPLLADIQAANEAGLAVILDFHPVILSPQHMQKATRDFWKNPAMDTTTYTYPGTYSYPFLEGTGAPTDPLSIFWKSFVLELESQFDEAGMTLNRNMVFLEILNEPFEPIISAPGSNSEEYLRVFLPEGIGAFSSRTEWRQNSIQNFHDAVGAAITEIQNINDEYTIIVPNYISLPFGPKMYYQTPNAPSYYTVNEIPKIERLIYTWHLYEPMNFTHFKSFDFEYFQDRDWFGEEHAPELPAWNPYDCDGLGDGFTPPVNLGNQSIIDVNNLIVLWSNNASVNLGYHPMVYFGEFGCEYKPTVVVSDPFLDLPGGPPTSPAVVNQREAQRYQWLFDIRKFVETEVPNSGWSVYAYVGYMPIFRKSNGVTGDLYAPTDFNAHGPNRGDIHDNTSRALFGNVRPIGGGL